MIEANSSPEFNRLWAEALKESPSAESCFEAFVESCFASENWDETLDLKSKAVFKFILKKLRVELESKEGDSGASFLHAEVNLYRLFVNLNAEDPRYRERLIQDFFGEEGHQMNDFLENTLEPKLKDFFERKVEEQEGCDRFSADELISRFVDSRKFKSCLKSFKKQENLGKLDERYCAKIFYKTFKTHFDSRKGMGVTEMLQVGKEKPEELKKMSLMKEYDDIRASLLRLQLLGVIDSKNYR